MISQQLLYKEYINNQLSASQIGEKYDFCKSAILRGLRNANIPRRSNGYGFHLRKGNNIVLTTPIIDFLNGEILGDGGYEPRSQYSACFHETSKYKEYLEWLWKQFKGLGFKKAGEIYKSNSEKYEWYEFKTLSYSQLIEQHKLWYLNNKKILPQKLKLTPITLRQWYLGDGSFSKRNLTLAINDFNKKDQIKILNLLTNINIQCTLNKNSTIYVRRKSHNTFFNYIGSCPKEIKHLYGYKWEI